MKMVTAIIQPYRLDQVREALTGIGVEGMTVMEVRGYGRQKGHTEIYRGAEYQINYLPKVKMEVVVTDEISVQVVDTIASAAKTNKIGDGKIFVWDIEAAVRIRTGERGADAL